MYTVQPRLKLSHTFELRLDTLLMQQLHSFELTLVTLKKEKQNTKIYCNKQTATEDAINWMEEEWVTKQN